MDPQCDRPRPVASLEEGGEEEVRIAPLNQTGRFRCRVLTPNERVVDAVVLGDGRGGNRLSLYGELPVVQEERADRGANRDAEAKASG